MLKDAVNKIKEQVFLAQLRRSSKKTIRAMAEVIQPPVKAPPIYMEFVEDEDTYNEEECRAKATA